MKLLGSKPPKKPVTADGALIVTLPRKQVEVEKVTDQTGTGHWFDGRVLFISDEEVVVVPTRCRASNIFGAASRMPRAAKPGLPKKMRKGKAKRIHSVLVELIEHARD